MPDEVPGEPRRNTGTGNERPSTTSTSRKPLTGDSNDPRELYAFSLSEIQVREKERDEKGEKVIPTDSEVILRMEEEIDGVSGETRSPLACPTFCRPSFLSFHSDIALQLISLKSPHVPAIYVHPRAAPACRHH